ncbi:MAG: Rne/Rng family ribonuclease [Candidatus Ancillula sp.]|jgi:ribonuclease E|nr:Rne/Rng family ribonuclease [Candidatus Ancillula sp.]
MAKKEIAENEAIDAPLFKSAPIKTTSDDLGNDDIEKPVKRVRKRKVTKSGVTKAGAAKSSSDKESKKDLENSSNSEENAKVKNAKANSNSNDNEKIDKFEEETQYPKRSRKRTRNHSRSDKTNKSDKNSSENSKTENKSSNKVNNKPNRMDAKKQRRKDTRDLHHRHQLIQEADFLAKRENVDRKMIIKQVGDSEQIAVLEDGVLVEHYVSEQSETSVVGNVYLGKVQNVLPGMEAAFVDIGEGRNAVLYAGEVNWDATQLDDSEPRRIEQVLAKGDSVLVQVTKDPINLKGARLTSQITLAGRYLVLVPSKGINGISRKLPERERRRLKDILHQFSNEDFSIIVRTAAQGIEEADLVADIERLKKKWEKLEAKAKKAKAPSLLLSESDLTTRVVRDAFNESFSELIVSGDDALATVNNYLEHAAADLLDRVVEWTGGATGKRDIFEEYKVHQQLAKALDHKVWLPSGGTLIIDKTEAMTVIDVNTGKFIGNDKESTLEETVTKNNLEAAEEIVRQLRLRDVGGIIVIDFIDMILPENRERVLERMIECLARDRTKHQVAEVTSLGLVQLTRKRVGQGLLEAFSTTCEQCQGRGYIVHAEPVVKDINAMIHHEEPQGYDHFLGASHELEDGTKMADIQEVDDQKKEENKKRMAAIAASLNQDMVKDITEEENE